MTDSKNASTTVAVRLCSLLLAGLLCTAATASAARAPATVSSPGSAPSASQPPPSGVPTGHIVDGPVEERLGRRLRCPVCQGMSIGDSPSPMAQDMMRQVRKLHQEGRSEADIVAYFTARYGDWVLLDPPAVGFGMWVWVLPPMALLAGFMLVWRRAAASSAALPTDGSTQDAVPSALDASSSPATDSEATLLAAIREHVKQ